MTIPKVIQLTAEHHNLSYDQLLSHDNSQTVSDARFMAMALCKLRFPRATEVSMACFFRRDRSTLSYGALRAKALASNYPDYNERFTALRRLLGVHVELVAPEEQTR